MTANTPNITITERHDILPASRDQWSFARQLRALGQALEKFGFSAFDLEIRWGTYLIIDKGHLPAGAHFSWTRLLSRLFQGTATPSSSTESRADLRFSLEDIEHFDLHGKNKRKDGSKMPDPYGVSELLRGAGFYLDNHNVMSEVDISLVDRWMVICYQNADGKLERIQRDIEYFYDYGVNMYLRRSNRIKLAAETS